MFLKGNTYLYIMHLQKRPVFFITYLNTILPIQGLKYFNDKICFYFSFSDDKSNANLTLKSKLYVILGIF